MARALFVPLLLANIETASCMSMINVASGKCLDLLLPCADGTYAKHCQRAPTSSLYGGVNLQMYPCHGSGNQQFELLSSGQLRNPATNLCLDVQAQCTNGLPASECTRASAKDIPSQANVQLWSCRNATAETSVSHGNQRFSFRNGGALRNLGSGLCLEARGLRDGSVNVQAGVCTGARHQTFELETGDAAARIKELAAGVQVLQDGALPAREVRKRNTYVTIAVPAMIVLGAMFVALTLRRGDSARQPQTSIE